MQSSLSTATWARARYKMMVDLLLSNYRITLVPIYCSEVLQFIV